MEGARLRLEQDSEGQEVIRGTSVRFLPVPPQCGASVQDAMQQVRSWHELRAVWLRSAALQSYKLTYMADTCPPSDINTAVRPRGLVRIQ